MEGDVITMSDFDLPHSTRFTNFLVESSPIEPTHESGNIFDLIITNNCEIVSLLAVKELSFRDPKLIKSLMASKVTAQQSSVCSENIELWTGKNLAMLWSYR